MSDVLLTQYQPGTCWRVASRFFFQPTWHDLLADASHTKYWLDIYDQFVVLGVRAHPTDSTLGLVLEIREVGGAWRTGWMPVYEGIWGLRHAPVLPLFAEVWSTMPPTTSPTTSSTP